MSVRFGSDGTISCNTVKYNYKQTRNLVADNGYSYGYWILDGCEIINAQGSRNFSENNLCFPSGDGVKMSVQVMPTPIANHKYYGGLLWKTTGSEFSRADGRFEWFYTDGDNNVQLTFAFKDVSTNNNWVKLSSVLQAGSNPTEGQWTIRNFIVNGSTDSYCAKPIIIDLTECFGEGNEPTKEWCDENILEWNKYIGKNLFKFNENNVSSSITFREMTYGSTYNITNGNQYFINRTDIPRSYNIDMQSGTASESYINLPAVEMNTSMKYYAFVELSQPNGNQGLSYDWYFPVAYPPLDSIPQAENGQFNSGGGLYNWKRISFFNIRDLWDNGVYESRFDFNNMGNANYLALTNFFISSVATIELAYNTAHNTSVDENYINKEFCDRHVSGDCDCIIRIKTHLDTKIKFNENYDIICNDIEIDPSVSSITYNNTGTIKCKRLIREQLY